MNPLRFLCWFGRHSWRPTVGYLNLYCPRCQEFLIDLGRMRRLQEPPIIPPFDCDRDEPR